MVKSLEFIGTDNKINYIIGNTVLEQNLLDRRFEFSSNKINVLFGPNASGKSTIIKAISSYCLCGDKSNNDGLTNMFKYEPLDFIKDFWEDTKCSMEDVITESAGNQVDIEWDGGFVYNDNFSKRRGHSIGDLTGSILDDVGEELHYMFGKDKSSLGQLSIFMINKITKLCTSEIKFSDMVKRYEKRINSVNDSWANAYKQQYEYLSKFHKDDNCQMTVLLDEIDKSLDINNIIKLYTIVLPQLIKKYNVQIILVSHSPIILSDSIFNSEDYNIISLDENYTKTTRENLLTIFK